MESALAQRIKSSREEILVAWEAGVRTLASAAHASPPALFNEVPRFLDWLVERLEAPDGAPEEQRDAFGLDHAGERVAQGFDVVEVVAELALLRECLLEAWASDPTGITPQEIRRMDAEIDHVLAMVAMQYVHRAGAEATRANEGAPGGA